MSNSVVSKYSKIDTLIEQAEREGKRICLLESQQPEHNGSSKVLLGIGCVDAVEIPHHSEEDPWRLFSQWLKKRSKRVCGYLSYDLKNWSEPGLKSENPSTLDDQVLHFWEPEIWIEIDAFKSELTCAEVEGFDFSVELDKASESEKRAYINAIKEAQKAIYEGEYYEINLSRNQTGRFEGRPYDLYRTMRRYGPVPMGGFLQWGDWSVISLSPERFLKRTGNEIYSEPIKGTRGRGGTPEADRISKEELLNSVKERAENLMIVDLVRNDLSRVCKPGSVTAENLFEIRSYRTVHQMVSVVEGELRDDVSVEDILRAAFPMGSMTGAPKRAAMEDIDRLEIYRRGIYSGAIGYIDPDGNFDFNVVIRTAIIRGDQLVYPVGGAITADSDPQEEWVETEVKTAALTQAVGKQTQS